MAPRTVTNSDRVYSKTIALTGNEILKGAELARSRRVSFSAMMRDLLQREFAKEEADAAAKS